MGPSKVNILKPDRENLYHCKISSNISPYVYITINGFI